MRTVIDQAYISNLLTTPEETILVDVNSYTHLYDNVKDKLKMIDGLYIHGSVKPIIEFNTRYYVYTGDAYKLITSIDDIKTTKSDIYMIKNGLYEVYYRYSALKKIVNNLTITPAVNYVYYKFIEGMVVYILQQFLEYSTYPDHRKVVSCLKPEYASYITSDEYIDDFNDIYDLVSDIVYKHRWSIYFVKAVNSSILIERGADHRVYEWCLLQLADDTEE